MKTLKGSKGWFAIKLDLEKAFDRIEWSFIHECLVRCKIDKDTIALIMDCTSSSTTQILINGHTTPSFSPSIGIRQGDPLSPYLFIICMEALSMLIHEATNTSEWTPFPLGKGGVTFSHLLFADDILLFGGTNEHTLCALQHALHSFCLASGQKINFNKSKLHFSKYTPPRDISLFEIALGLKHSNSLGTYLGFPLTNRKPSKTEIQPIIDKIHSKLANWKTKFLSRAGRLCLITSTLNAIPNHYMQCMLLPASFHYSMDRIVNNFLWSGSMSKNKIHLINWHQVTKPKPLGGLGIRRATILNKAHSAKLCWKTAFLHDNIATIALRSKYILNRRAPSPFNTGSHIWKNIGKGWPTIKSSYEWSIGNGQSISLWDDNWTPLGRLRHLITGPFNCDSVKATVSLIIVNGMWNFCNLDFVLPPLVVSTIQSIPLPSSSRNDIASSSLASNLSFSLGRAYSFIISDHSHHSINPHDDFKWLWKCPTQPRIKLFIWLAWWDRIPHKSTLHSRSIVPNAMCNFCNNQCENTIHILRDCPTARDAWNSFALPTDFYTLNLKEWIQCNSSSPNKNWSTLFTFITWRLWLRRNNKIFNLTNEPIGQFWINSVTHECYAWTSKQTSDLQPTAPIASPTLNPVSWAPPTVLILSSLALVVWYVIAMVCGNLVGVEQAQ